MLKIPTANRRVRLVVMGFGLLLFLWLTPEDQQTWRVTLLGLGLAALIVLLSIMNKFGGRIIAGRYFVPGAVVIGSLIGLGTSIATAGLMFFKNALHAHLFLDFPIPLIVAILERAPAWGLGGGLIGLGIALAWMAWQPSAAQSKQQLADDTEVRLE